jgi:CHAT domain-containing protein
MVNTFAKTVLLCLELGDTARAFDLAERSRARALLDALGAGGAAIPRDFERRPLTLRAIQSRLPADTVVLAYFNTGLTELHERARPSSLPPRHRFAPEHVLLFAVTAGGVEAHVLAGVSPNSLRPGDIRAGVEHHVISPELRARLYEHLVAPAAHLLRGRRTVAIVPHGPLHYVPFHALLAPDGEPLLREDGPDIVYSPSCTLLVRGARAQRRAPEPCLAVGYNGQAGDRLRYAEDEARLVARLCGGAALDGPTPKKHLLLATAHRYGLIHFCCHGTFNEGLPLSSALHIAPGEALSAREVLDSLHLRCDLATLSACETGLSRVASGDELYGLARAFLTAGAPAILCPLWRVDDQSTRLLMEQFYRAALGGTPFAEALRRAQLFLRRLTRAEAEALLGERLGELARATGAVLGREVVIVDSSTDERPFADPYYWAPFILIGRDGTLGRSGPPHAGRTAERS